MPRIYTSESDPLDFCKGCFPNEADAFKKYGTLGDGPDNRGNCFGYDAGHPPYEEESEPFRCEVCHKKLVAKDN